MIVTNNSQKAAQDIRVLVPLAQGCEELEAVTIIDLLRRAGIQVTTAAVNGNPVTASRGVVLVADALIDDALADQYDMVVLPGGLPGSIHLAEHAGLVKKLQETIRAGAYVGAICAAPKVLAEAGLLEGRSATAYPGIFDNHSFVGIKMLEDAVVRDGPVITSRGPGTAMDFALELIAMLAGAAVRDDVLAGLKRT